MERTKRSQPSSLSKAVFVEAGEFAKRQDIVSMKEAARIMGITRSDLRRLVYGGFIEAERTQAGFLRFRLAAITDFFLERETRRGGVA